jgi:hypothetical protein
MDSCQDHTAYRHSDIFSQFGVVVLPHFHTVMGRLFRSCTSHHIGYESVDLDVKDDSESSVGFEAAKN